MNHNDMEEKSLPHHIIKDYLFNNLFMIACWLVCSGTVRPQCDGEILHSL